MSTINAVAKKAGVSVASVSRYINSPRSVSSKTSERIEKAIQELQYVPNVSARNLRKLKSGAILIVVPDLTEPSFSQIIMGVNEAARELGYFTLISQSKSEKTTEIENFELLRSRQVDGAIFAQTAYNKQLMKKMSSDYPIVHCAEFSEEYSNFSISIDNYQAARAATRYLLNLGHKNIAFFKYDSYRPSEFERLRGYKDELEAEGVEYKSEYIAEVHRKLNSEQIVSSVHRLLSLHQRPTAFLCMSDMLALSAIRISEDVGFCVPDDLSVMGFDNIQSSSMFHPTITTIDQSHFEQGKQAMQHLSKLIDSQSYMGKMRLYLNYTLIERESTAAFHKVDLTKTLQKLDVSNKSLPEKPENKEDINVCVVGVGVHGTDHIKTIKSMRGINIVAVVDKNLTRAFEVAQRFDIPAYYDNCDKALRNTSFSVLHNCTPNSEHFLVNTWALEHDINIYCATPLCLTSMEASQICKIANEKNIHIGVDFIYKKFPLIQDMRKRILEEDWGKTYILYGSYLQDWLMYKSDVNWRCNSNIAGPARVLTDIGIHVLGLVQFIVHMKIKKVMAKLSVALPERMDSNGDSFESKTEDTASILVSFENGTIGNFMFSQVSSGIKNYLCLEVYGSSYSMKWQHEFSDDLLIGDRKKGGTECITVSPSYSDSEKKQNFPSDRPYGWRDALKDDLMSFYSVIKDCDKPINYTSYEESAYLVNIVEACIKSNKNNMWVDVVDTSIETPLNIVSELRQNATV